MVVVGAVVVTVGGCVTGGVVGGGVVDGAVGRGIVVTVGGRVVVGATVTVGRGGGAVVTVGGAGAVVVGGAGVGLEERRGGSLAVSPTASVASGTPGFDATSSTLSVGGSELTTVVSALVSSSATESLVPESSGRLLTDASSREGPRSST